MYPVSVSAPRGGGRRATSACLPAGASFAALSHRLRLNRPPTRVSHFGRVRSARPGAGLPGWSHLSGILRRPDHPETATHRRRQNTAETTERKHQCFEVCNGGKTKPRQFHDGSAWGSFFRDPIVLLPYAGRGQSGYNWSGLSCYAGHYAAKSEQFTIVRRHFCLLLHFLFAFANVR